MKTNNMKYTYFGKEYMKIDIIFLKMFAKNVFIISWDTLYVSHVTNKG